MYKFGRNLKKINFVLKNSKNLLFATLTSLGKTYPMSFADTSAPLFASFFVNLHQLDSYFFHVPLGI